MNTSTKKFFKFNIPAQVVMFLIILWAGASASTALFCCSLALLVGFSLHLRLTVDRDRWLAENNVVVVHNK